MDTGPERDVEKLYREHGARIWRAVYGYSGDREVANDALAEAFAQAIRRGDAIESPLAWIWRAAFRIAAGELKERRARTVLAFEGSYEMPETSEDLVRLLGQLSESQRAALVLHHYAGYPADEIAEMIGSTSAAVRVHLMRGRRRLRELLRDDDDRP